MVFDIPALAPKDAYKVLTNLVVPRPIALVTTLSAKGVVNAAPFSFFNMLGNNPPVVALGISPGPGGAIKHTAANIEVSKQFVVNIVTEEIANAMNICGVDFPENESELEVSGLTATPSTKVAPPRILEAPAALECKLMDVHTLGKNRIIFGEVISLFVRDEVVDAKTFYVAHEKVHIIGRMGSPNWYARTREQFELPRLSYDALKLGQQNKG